MIAYTTVITNNIAKSAAFYDALLAEVGGKRIMEVNRVILWGGAEGAPLFCVAEPENGAPATVGNGCMIALGASSTEEVDRLHAKVIELGAKDEGTLGPRENKDLKFYAGYFRDPEGNKLNLFHMQDETNNQLSNALPKRGETKGMLSRSLPFLGLRLSVVCQITTLDRDMIRYMLSVVPNAPYE